MKKTLCLIAFSLLFSNTAHADRIIVLDENNNVKQEIYTQTPYTQTTTSTTTYVQPQPVYVQQPQQVVVTEPVQPVVVVRPRPVVRSYYYDSTATSLLAGFTGAIIGNAIFRHGGHHHHGGRGHHHRRH